MSDNVTVSNPSTGGVPSIITKNGRGLTSGIDFTLDEALTETGDTYNITTEALAINAAGETAVFYLKNNNDTELIINNFICSIKDFTGTDDQPSLFYYRNPTSGTIVSGANSALITNRNHGEDTSSFDIDAFKMNAVSDTLTGHDAKFEIPLASTAVSTFFGDNTIVVIPTGKTNRIHLLASFWRVNYEGLFHDQRYLKRYTNMSSIRNGYSGANYGSKVDKTGRPMGKEL